MNFLQKIGVGLMTFGGFIILADMFVPHVQEGTVSAGAYGSAPVGWTFVVLGVVVAALGTNPNIFSGIPVIGKFFKTDEPPAPPQGGK